MNRDFFKKTTCFSYIQYLPIIPGTILFFSTIFLYFTDNTFFLNFFEDDTFYYFIIAENLAKGYIFSYDLITSTNGFHPLWVFVIAPFMENHEFLFPLLISVICITLSQVLFINTIQHLFERKIAIIVALFVTCNPGFILIAYNGIETSLFLLILNLYLYQLVKIKEFTFQKCILMGILAGFLFLARTDSCIIIALSMLFYILTNEEVISYITKLIKILIWGFISIMVASPWLLFSYIKYGNLIQDSGISYTHLLIRELFIGYGADLATYFHFVLLLIGRMIKHISDYSGYPIIIIIFLSICGFYLSLSWKKDKRYLFIAIFYLYYIFILLLHSFRLFPREWYIAPFIDLMILILAILINLVITKIGTITSLKSNNLLYIAIIILFIAVPVYASQQNVFEGPHPKNIYSYFTIKNTINPFINNSSIDIIGSSDAGFHGWFFPVPVVNLDGLMNHEAYEHIQTGDMISFLKQYNITYFIIRPPLQNEWYMGNGSGLWYYSIPIGITEGYNVEKFSKSYYQQFSEQVEIQKLLLNNSEIVDIYFYTAIMPFDKKISHYLGSEWAIPFQIEYRIDDTIPPYWFPFTSHYSKSNDYATSKGSESNIYLPLKLNESYRVNLSLSLNTKQESNISKIFIIDNQTQMTAPISPDITNLTLNITATHDVTHIIMSNPDNEQDSSSVNLWGIYITNLSDTTTQYQ